MGGAHHTFDGVALPAGTRVQNFEIIKVLGQGGFGITYLVSDTGLNKLFALKEYFPSDLARRDGITVRIAMKSGENDFQWGLRKFNAEARLLAQLNHPNIVRVLHFFEANSTCYMALEYVDGETLDQWLCSTGEAPRQDAIDAILLPLLSALEVVHQQNSWHLDISPDNIMIRRSDGAPVLLDFGAARDDLKQHSQLLSALVFKSGYSAPEQYTSSPERYGPWTDIYALGATLYRAVTGQRPVEATERQLHDQLQPAVRAARGQYRSSFLRAIDWALTLQPGLRPQSIAAWRAAVLKTNSKVSATKVVEAVSPAMFFNLLARVAKLDFKAPRIAKSVELSTTLIAGAVVLLASYAYRPLGNIQRPVQAPAAAVSTSPPIVRKADVGKFIVLEATLIAKSKIPNSAVLGVEVDNLEQPLATALGLAAPIGAFVVSATPASPAASAGIRPGDVITSIAGKDVKSVAQLLDAIAGLTPGARANVEVWRFGDGPKDQFDLVQRLAATGDAHMMYRLGLAHQFGIGTERNLREAELWYERASDAGDPYGITAFANVKLQDGPKRNVVEALRLVRKAADQGYPPAMKELGNQLLDSSDPNDRLAALNWLQRAGEQGNIDAMWRLGRWFAKQDKGQAARWYQKAADLGSVSSMIDLGLLQEQTKDFQAAMRWYMAAARLGNSTGYNNVANLLDNGQGVDEPMPERAAEFMMVALRLGDENALKQMLTNSGAWKPAFRATLQLLLSRGGYYSGPIDGAFGPQTFNAIRDAARN